MKFKTFSYYTAYISLCIGTLILVKVIDVIPNWFGYFPLIALAFLMVSTMLKFIENWET